jgi:CRISPR/Cas system-associated endonuclease Cas1
MMTDYQSLVLHANGLHRLWLQDNGLRIIPKFSSERRVPICRLLRVQCYGNIGLVKDGFCTLLSIAKQHIPVTFFDEQGHVCAQLYHPCPQTNL